MDKFIMFEVPVTSVKRAAAFYKAAFGWKIQSWDGSFGIITVPENENWVPKEKGAINGEMYRKGRKDKGPIVVILVGSITRTIAKLKKAGGKVVQEKEPYEVGVFMPGSRTRRATSSPSGSMRKNRVDRGRSR